MKHVKQFEAIVAKRFEEYYDFLREKYGANHVMFGDKGK